MSEQFPFGRLRTGGECHGEGREGDAEVSKERQAEPIALSILVPVRNEGLNVRVMLKVLRAVVEVPHEVLVVHDEADDDSVAVVA